MIDAAGFFHNNLHDGLCQKPVLQSLAEESDVDEMSERDHSIQLSDEQYLLVSGIVRGFDLKTKDWCKWIPALWRSQSPSLLTTLLRPVPC